MVSKADNRYLLKSLNKALKVLDILSVKDGMSLTEICSVSGINKTSAFKILYTLERRAFVFKTPDARYKLGEKFERYRAVHQERKNIVDVSMPIIHELVSYSHETVSLAILNFNGRSLNLYSSSGDSPSHIPARIGLEIDAHSTATGKVLLANTSKDLLSKIIEKMNFRVYTEFTIKTAEELFETLALVRKQGYCQDSEERYPNRSTIAAPVFDENSACVAALGLVCTTDVYLEKRDDFRPRIISAAASISQGIGFSPEG